MRVISFLAKIVGNVSEIRFLFFSVRVPKSRLTNNSREVSMGIVSDCVELTDKLANLGKVL